MKEAEYYILSRHLGGCNRLYRQTVFLIFFSVLLVGLGFLLGQYYAVSRGMLWQGNSLLVFPESTIFQAGDGKEPKFTSRQSSGLCNTEELINVGLSEGKESLHFPSQVGALKLDRIVSGEEALAYSQKIHGDEAAIKRVFILHYSSRDEQVILWFFEFETVEKALKHLEKVNLRINGSSTFNERGSFFLQSEEVFYVQSLNINNYYYCINDVICWVSIIADDPIPLFLQLYEHFNLQKR